MSAMKTPRSMRVISLSRGSVACEFATRLAVDAGLAVIKVELPDGDPLRGRPGHLFAYLAAGKQSVAVEEHQLHATLRVMLQQADAVVVDAWGRTVVTAVTHTVPTIVVGERDGSALDGMPEHRGDEFLAFHGTGLGYITPRVMPGYPSHAPLCPSAHLVEMMAGLYGAIALFALLGREQIDAPATHDAAIGLTAVALPLLRREVAAVLYEQAQPHRSERIWKVSPAEVHRCRDGWVFVDVIEDAQWVRLCEYIGRPDLGRDDRYATRDQRFTHAELICTILDAYFATRSKSCWIDAQAQGVPVAPVNSLNDLLQDPQLAARNFWTRLATADGAQLVAPSSPIARLFGGPNGSALPRVPAIGEHNAALQRALTAA